MDASAVFGTIGTVTTIAMFSSPAKHFRLIVRQRDVGEWSVLPYIVGFAQCLLWFVYDIVAGLQLHACCNLFGMIIQLVFVLIFAICAKGRHLAVLGGFVAAVGVASAVCLVVLLTGHAWSFLPQPEEERAQAVLGGVCVVVCVSMYAAPLDVTRKVMMRRVAVEECLPWLYSLNIVINLSMWVTYGLLVRDANVWLPAGLGSLLGLMQLLLYVCYRNLPPQQTPEIEPTVGNSDKA